jgi:aryl-alcohol dehydrogenase-like predicted oxidoreductase
MWKLGAGVNVFDSANAYGGGRSEARFASLFLR